MKVLFAGGGSGGHLYPALAIARALVRANPEIEPFFIGARRGIERDILPESEFQFKLLDLHPLYRSQPWLNWRTVVGSLGSWREISRISAKLSPRALVATGGYAAGIALAVASRRGIPIVIQEQNSVPGLTVRRYASRAVQLHLGFPEARRLLKLGARTRVFESGNPIAPPVPMDRRPSLAQAARTWGFTDSRTRTLLVFGGSQGSEAMNRVVAQWLERATVPVRVIWATGPANLERYTRLESRSVRVVPYISNMADAYGAADLALTRAGAMTTAELSAWGIPAVLVPLPTAAADHQTHNAQAMAASGAAMLIRQGDLTPELLGSTIDRLSSDVAALNGMREKMLIRARPKAAQEIAGHILALDALK